ncbi:MAG: LD-carboxypeptidase [Flavobacteriales bacterium]|nr:LD-carboxypeptidase [Flavobacteriales bacterium]MCB9167834.1 LD-carboxypeptidase [Flavobacteriales bacterium]
MSATPPPLRPGSTIAIIPTARAISPDELREGIALAESWGLRVRSGAGVGRKDFQQAGTSAERLADLQSALDDPEIEAVWCARGGYGTVHLMEGLDLTRFRARPKWVIGFSDITVLHNRIHGEGIATLHAQMPYAIAGKTEHCRTSLHDALFGTAPPIAWDRPAEGPWKEGTVVAPVVGGNLSVLLSLRGTPYDLDPGGKILFLEDLDELRYHVDRMVQNIRSGGWFTRAAGLVVGGMTDMRDKDPADPFGRDALTIIHDALSGSAIPVACGMPVGHIADNRALVLGRNATLDITREGAVLRFDRA